MTVPTGATCRRLRQRPSVARQVILAQLTVPLDPGIAQAYQRYQTHAASVATFAAVLVAAVPRNREAPAYKSPMQRTRPLAARTAAAAAID